MTQQLKIFRETALPGALEPFAMYLIAPAGKPDYVEAYVTGATSATVKRFINEADVQAMIDAAIAGFDTLEIVADIAARDALNPDVNVMVLVLDATADGSVDAGGATYAFQAGPDTWVKVSEAESMDVVLQWTNIVGKPTSAPADIDEAVAQRHTHTNKTELDRIGQDANGNMTYGGQPVATAWASTGW